VLRKKPDFSNHDRVVSELLSRGLWNLRFSENVNLIVYYEWDIKIDGLAEKPGIHKETIYRYLQNENYDEELTVEDCIINQLDIHLIPDAYEIDIENNLIKCYEVEVHNPISLEKIHKYINLWWALDNYEWNLELTAVSKYGSESVLFGPTSTGNAQFFERFKELDPDSRYFAYVHHGQYLVSPEEWIVNP
jgi:hypothetical protein